MESDASVENCNLLTNANIFAEKSAQYMMRNSAQKTLIPAASSPGPRSTHLLMSLGCDYRVPPRLLLISTCTGPPPGALVGQPRMYLNTSEHSEFLAQARDADVYDCPSPILHLVSLLLSRSIPLPLLW